MWNGLPQKNCPVATWMNGSCRGATRPLVNELRHSSQRSTMRSPNLGIHPTHPAYVPLLPTPLLRSTVLNKKNKTVCLRWLSQWPRIFACSRPLAGRQKPPTNPNRVGQLQLSLDEPIYQLDKRHFTSWRSCNCSRQNSLDKSNPNPAAFNKLRSATNLALCATKMTAQAIGRSMASLVVLERHLCLNLREIKDADKVPFLNSPVSPTSLFGPAVVGFAECFTAGRMWSQAMRHFLPKRSSSAAASSRPKMAPT